MKTQRQEVTIEKIVAGGFGLARPEGEVVLVPRVTVGERVAVEVDRSRSPARGRLLAVVEPASTRIPTLCPVFDKCGGCDLMFLSAEGQRDARIAILREALGPLGANVEIEWHAATPARGRTRVRWHCKVLGSGPRARVVVGHHALGAPTIVDLDACLAIDARLEAALDDVRAILAGAKGDGEISAALGKEGRPVLAITWNGEIAPAGFGASEAAVRSGRLAGVEIQLPDARLPATIGDTRPVSIAADGGPMITPTRGFAQASEVGDRVLVEIATRRAAAHDKQVLELFSGSGNLTVALAREASFVTAVEHIPAACAAARENLASRGLGTKVKVVESDADTIEIPRGIEVVVLDPPRAGARGAIAKIAKSKLRRVVYVSCDPATLARDLATLVSAGFAIEAIDALDLFPDTSHVETVVTLSRAKS